MKKKLKDLLRESNVWDRKFGESLPTLKDTTAKYAAKQNMVKEGFADKKYPCKVVAQQMIKEPGRSKGWFGKSWAKAICKKYPNGVSERDLDRDLPDYVFGGAISDLFDDLHEGKVNEAFEGLGGIVTPQAFGKGKGFRTSPKKQIKEVGASAEFKKYQKNIEDNMENLTDSVRELKNLLMKVNAKNEARELGSIYATSVGRFHKFLTTKFVQMIRKLI